MTTRAHDIQMCILARKDQSIKSSPSAGLNCLLQLFLLTASPILQFRSTATSFHWRLYRLKFAETEVFQMYKRFSEPLTDKVLNQPLSSCLLWDVGNLQMGFQLIFRPRLYSKITVFQPKALFVFLPNSHKWSNVGFRLVKFFLVTFYE